MGYTEQQFKNLLNTALDAIDYVGQYNGIERQHAAQQAVRLSFKTGKFIEPESQLEVNNGKSRS